MKIMKITGIVMTVFGGVFLFIVYTLFRPVMRHDVWIFNEWYGPYADPNGFYYHNYEDLSDWTDFLVHDRNHYAMSFYITLGMSCLIIGVILLLWRRDRMNLIKRMEGNQKL
ncbi:MAG: hypothetical protein WC454_08700 [Phycisphaerae bacterium]|jgi:hypothetical protein